MDIRITTEMFHALGAKAWKDWKITEDAIRYQRPTVDLARYSRFRALELKNLVQPLAETKIKGAPVALRDISLWLDAMKDMDKTRCKNTKHFFALLKALMLKTPGQRLYEKDQEAGVWWAYFMDEVKFSPRYETRDGVHPAYTRFSGYYFEFGKKASCNWTIYDEDCAGKTVKEVLHAQNLVPETEELRAEYMREYARWETLKDDVGHQCWATGIGTDDLDGNPSRNDSWWYSRVNRIEMERRGERSRVVVDVFREDNKEVRERSDERMEERFWWHLSHETVTEEGEHDEEESQIAAEDDLAWEPPEVPIHLRLAVFDLRKHLRLRIHVQNLEEYQYDTDLGAKLVLPEDDRALVDILLQHKSHFADIISGKGSGAIVLCTGLPGLGKTLTAEVYAEVTERPLYTVQCSQLGVTPNKLEDELLKVFARSERWNAILLLDEADVYVSPRGNDLHQNAIVGVFLRTLEYYKGVLFMTTNRADLVDDAIASRCIARLTYQTPTSDAQARIWRILAGTSGANLSDANIKRIVAAYPHLSGRDVKNLLKLALLIGEARKEKEVTLSTIKFVKRFKPTLDGVDKLQMDAEME
jgi:hypothetical protein